MDAVTALVLELRDALDAGADDDVIAELWIQLVERAEREERRRPTPGGGARGCVSPPEHLQPWGGSGPEAESCSRVVPAATSRGAA